MNQPVAIEITLPDSGQVEVTDTFRPRGRALNGLGDSVQAPLFWFSFDSTLKMLDSTTGVSLAVTTGAPLTKGSGRIQAHTTGNLFSDLLPVSILPRLDSLVAGGPRRDTVSLALSPDSLSDSLQVRAYAFDGQTAGVAASRTVIFSATVFPDSGPVVTLLPRDTVATDLSGLAVTRVRLHAGPLPDSVVVTAAMKHVNGTGVPGSPLTFVVEFRP